MKWRPGSVSSEAFQTWTVENYKSLCVCSMGACEGTGGGEAEREAGARVCLEPPSCSCVMAGRHLADLEFPLGDGPRCNILCG